MEEISDKTLRVMAQSVLESHLVKSVSEGKYLTLSSQLVQGFKKLKTVEDTKIRKSLSIFNFFACLSNVAKLTL